MPSHCAQCAGTVFDVQITASGIDSGVDVGTSDLFLLNRDVIDHPDGVAVEAVCRQCGHARYVPNSEWRWA